MASYLGLSKKFLPNLRQYEATTGRQISDKAMQNYLYAALQTEADRKDRERQFGLQERGLNIQEKAYKDQASAATMKGITDIAGLPVQGYLGYKALQSAGVFGKTAPAVTTAATTGTAQGLLAGGTAPITAQGAVGLSVPEISAGLGYGAAETPGLAATFAGGETAGSGLLGAGALPALGVGLLSGGAGYGLSKLLHANKDITKGITGTAAGIGAGAMLGAEIGSIGGPLGALIGGAIGFISSLF